MDVERAVSGCQNSFIAAYSEIVRAEDGGAEVEHSRRELTMARHLASIARAALKDVQSSGAPQAQMEGCRGMCDHHDREVRKKTRARDVVVNANGGRITSHESDVREWHAALAYSEYILEMSRHFPNEYSSRKR